MTGSIIGQMIQNLQGVGFFAYLLPWLLTLAIVFGILEHYDMPESTSARGVIAIVAAFIVLPVGNVIAPFLESLVTGLIALGMGIIVAIIFVELLGYKSGDVENIFMGHPKIFGTIMIALAVLVFVGAGGMDLIGVEISISTELITLLAFLLVISLGVWFIANED